MQAKRVNRAAIVDANFTACVEALTAGRANPNLLEGSGLDAEAFLKLFQSQMRSRHLDLMARALRLEDKVFYTIGSAGHEGNAMLGRLSRHTDPAFLHYRSGAFMMERSRFDESVDPILDTALSFAASAEDPASGGRHKVWGSRSLWVLPQTSTIASHLPKAVGCALAVDQARRIGHTLPVPEDSIVICSFGDASLNHSTAQGALNAAQWSSHQGIPVPILFVCEDNDWGISVRTPPHWVANSVRDRFAMEYRAVDGLDLVAGFGAARDAVEYCRAHRRPVFLHLKTVRLMGHAGTDFEVDYRSVADLEASESRDPLLCSARQAVAAGLLTPAQVIDWYETIRSECMAAGQRAASRPRLTTAEQVMAPLAPLNADAVAEDAGRLASDQNRRQVFGDRLPESRGDLNLAQSINLALHDVLARYDNSMVFGEDVAQKGGVYTVTRGLQQQFGGARVFNTLLDEQTILGLAQGYGALGMLPIPEIQYLAYYHNASDQLRGEACSLQFFSNNQFANPMVVRIAGLGYQKGFGGHFHNDNSFTALRDIPGLILACPSRGDDAVGMLRTLCATSKVSGRVSVFLEPIALYMTRDLYQAGDGQWLFGYPEAGHHIAVGSPRLYDPFATDLLIITYGNGVLMGLRAADRLKKDHGISTRTLDLRWLVPLNAAAIGEQARACDAVLVIDEGRHSGGVSEAVITALVEQGASQRPISRVTGLDSYTPLAQAASLVLPSDESVLKSALQLLARRDSPASVVVEADSRRDNSDTNPVGSRT